MTYILYSSLYLSFYLEHNTNDTVTTYKFDIQIHTYRYIHTSHIHHTYNSYNTYIPTKAKTDRSRFCADYRDCCLIRAISVLLERYLSY